MFIGCPLSYNVHGTCNQNLVSTSLSPLFSVNFPFTSTEYRKTKAFEQAGIINTQNAIKPHGEVWYTCICSTIVDRHM